MYSIDLDRFKQKNSKKNIYKIFFIVLFMLSYTNAQSLDKNSKKAFRTIHTNGTQIICSPLMNKFIISGEHYVISNQKSLSYLQKEIKRTYYNSKSDDLFQAIGDFTYECNLDGNNRIKAEISYEYYGEKYEDTSTRPWKVIKLNNFNPRMYPKYEGNLWYTHRLKLYRNDILIVDIDRFNGSGKYVRGINSISYRGELPWRRGLISIIYGLNVLHLGYDKWTTLPVNVMHKKGKIMTYIDILDQTLQSPLYRLDNVPSIDVESISKNSQKVFDLEYPYFGYLQSKIFLKEIQKAKSKYLGEY